MILVVNGDSHTAGAEIVDRWFQTICRGVAQETYEQFQADPDNRRDLGNGYTEVK